MVPIAVLLRKNAMQMQDTSWAADFWSSRRS